MFDLKYVGAHRREKKKSLDHLTPLGLRTTQFHSFFFLLPSRHPPPFSPSLSLTHLEPPFPSFVLTIVSLPLSPPPFGSLSLCLPLSFVPSLSPWLSLFPPSLCLLLSPSIVVLLPLEFLGSCFVRQTNHNCSGNGPSSHALFGLLFYWKLK